MASRHSHVQLLYNQQRDIGNIFLPLIHTASWVTACTKQCLANLCFYGEIKRLLALFKAFIEFLNQNERLTFISTWEDFTQSIIHTNSCFVACTLSLSLTVPSLPCHFPSVCWLLSEENWFRTKSSLFAATKSRSQTNWHVCLSVYWSSLLRVRTPQLLWRYAQQTAQTGLC